MNDETGMTAGLSIARLTAVVVRLSSRRPLATVAVALVLTVLAGVYTARTLGFVTSALRLLPQHAPYVVLLKEYLRDFGELNDIVVVVESSDAEAALTHAERLAGALAERLDARVTFRIDPAYLKAQGLLYLSVEDLERLRDRLFDGEELIGAYAERPSLPRLLEGLGTAIANAMALGFFDLGLGARPEGNLRVLEAILERMEARLAGPARYVSPWGDAFGVGRLDDRTAGAFVAEDGRLVFLFVQHRGREGEFGANRVLIDTIRATVRHLQGEAPGVRVGVTGAPAISTDEMATAFEDSGRATILALVMTLALLLAAFRRAGAPLLMAAALVAALVWALGLIALTVGHLSIFSVMFISLVIGIGIDYGIYFLYRYDQERARDAQVPAALRGAAESAGPGMLLGALTAAGAFLVLVLTDFQGVQEFGVVSAIAILTAYVAMVTLFPALLALADRRPPTPAATPEARWLADSLTRHRAAIAGVALVLSALAVWGATRVRFSYSMLELQARGVESVAWEKRILTGSGRSGFAAFATASSLDELRRKRDAFAALPSVARVESVLAAIPDRQPEKLAIVRTIAPLVADVRVAEPPPLEIADLRAPLETLRRRLALVAEAAETAPVGAQARAAVMRIDRITAALAAHATDARPALERLQAELAHDFADKLATLRASRNPRPVTPADLPVTLHDRYVGASGRLLLRVHPAVDIWQRQGAERFVGELRTVDPAVTGPAVTSFEAIRMIQRGYVEGTLYAFVLVALVSAASLRDVRLVALSLTPLVLGVLWTLGLMPVLDLTFNLANVWALPLIVGAAAEYGLNLVASSRRRRGHPGPALSRSVVMAVVVNGLTTIVGFGSLMIAHHQGVFGLGLLLTLGTVASLAASLLVLPVLLRWPGEPVEAAPRA
jgi:hopanoid biosynthesis associated RND transporter like protein HpnN